MANWPPLDYLVCLLIYDNFCILSTVNWQNKIMSSLLPGDFCFVLSVPGIFVWVEYDVFPIVRSVLPVSVSCFQQVAKRKFFNENLLHLVSIWINLLSEQRLVLNVNLHINMILTSTCQFRMSINIFQEFNIQNLKLH